MESGNLLVRTIKKDDFNAILKIAKEVGGGFTSLPNDVSVIRQKIKTAELSFKEQLPFEDRFFFFVLEDVASKIVIGTAAIQASRAKPSVFYIYEFEDSNKKHGVLNLKQKYNETSVFCTLYAAPNIHQKHSGRGKFISRSRCLFIAEFPNLFFDRFIAEMRAVLDENNESPFWNEIGRKAVGISYSAVNMKVEEQGYQSIVPQMPKQIDINILPNEVQQVLGKVNPKTEAALHILDQEGFLKQNDLDILDAGPIVTAEKEKLRSLKASRKLKIFKVEENMNTQGGQLMMIANTSLQDFKVSLGFVEFQDENLIIEKKIAELINCKVGDFIRFAPYY